ncbi:MAG: hypothetical protein JOS17DRAFT_771232 [Linnemannia elongata]|nr:MAG: hypothetical protein JOS17DRAFT_771232 [Linnemannia elongata]
MREELRRRRTTRDERRSTLQDTRYQQYAEDEKVYFEHLIAEVRQDNAVIFKMVEHEEELAEEELHRADVEGNGQISTHGGGNSPRDSSNRDGSQSSPLADTDLDTPAHMTNQLAGDGDFFTVDRLKQLRQGAQGGPEKPQNVRKIVKQLVHACVALGDDEVQKDGAEQQ